MTIHLANIDDAATLIPLLQNNSLNDALAALGEASGIPAATLQQDFKGEHCEIHTFYAGERRFYLLGLGPQPGFGEVLKAARSFSYKYRQKMPARLGVSFRFGNAAPAGPDLWVEALVNGLCLGAYQIGRFKTKNGNPHPLSRPEAELLLDLETTDPDTTRRAAERGRTIAETQMRIFDLVNAPSNKKHPSDLAAWALASGREYGYKVQAFDLEKIVATGLHALLAVNRGSEMPPAFIIMEYRPREGGNDLPTVGLVGKGVTFDTGGLSIKPSTNMHFMKSDMGGGAAVLGTMEAAARLQLPVHLVGIVPATDNSVDALSIKPSDVIDSYSGKTIEIIDTDAEGRLILADALAYMVRHYRPGVLIDLATLTGSTVRTFGYHAAALFSNSPNLSDRLQRLGDRTGERVWPLPLWDVYKDDLKSDVADIRNFSGKPLAGAIGAAKFLQAFTGDHSAWAHLDVAGVAFTDSEFANQKSATAYGIRLLIEFLRDMTHHSSPITHHP